MTLTKQSKAISEIGLNDFLP